MDGAVNRNGTDGLGGGSGGCRSSGNALGGNGVVILRRLTASSATTSGTTGTDGSDTTHTFNASGTYVA